MTTEFRKGFEAGKRYQAPISFKMGELVGMAEATETARLEGLNIAVGRLRLALSDKDQAIVEKYTDAVEGIDR
jgi:hypothetical protein